MPSAIRLHHFGLRINDFYFRAFFPLNMPLRISHATIAATAEVLAVDPKGQTVSTAMAGEYALTIYLDKREIVTLMTMGQNPEALAIGYLRNQRLVDSVDQIESVQVDWESAAVAIRTHEGVSFIENKMEKRTVTTGCGQGTVFGDLMQALDTVRLQQELTWSDSELFALLETIRLHETIYKNAGAVHGCALANRQGQLLLFHEDVGRHNAVDSIAGQMWIDQIDGSDKVFYTTGRLTSEMVIKTILMKIPFLVSRSGLTHMGFEIAHKAGLTMIGRAINKHYLLFTGLKRFKQTLASQPS